MSDPVSMLAGIHWIKRLSDAYSICVPIFARTEGCSDFYKKTHYIKSFHAEL